MLTAYRYRHLVAALALSVAVAPRPASAQLPLGELAIDGPATPEQISVVLPVTGALATTAMATVRYKPTPSSTWSTGHPLHRVRPDFSADDGPTVEDVFAWPIIDLAPGTTYDIEVSVTSSGTTNVKTLTTSTRQLPPPSGATTISIPAGSSATQIANAINSAPAGAVIELADGTYSLSGQVSISNNNGTAGSPIFVRGASRTGTILSRSGTIIQILGMSNVIFERMTLRGSGVDSGTAASSSGVTFFDGVPAQSRITFRNMTITGVDRGIVSPAGVNEVLVYDNTFVGNNQWTQDLFAHNGGGAPGAGDGTRDLEQNVFWNDDGVGVGGRGNAVFNNTIRGFGDTFTVSVGPDHPTSIGVHFYRNDVLMAGDDTFEADFGFRNVTFYDNRIRNAPTLVSFDPIYGGPAVIARNIAINVARGAYKLNNENTGYFLYNNLVVRPDGFGSGATWGWVQFNNGSLRSWGYVNNILIYRGSGKLMAIESTDNNPIDFHHNAWFSAGTQDIWWSSSGGSFANLADAMSGLGSTTPVFGSVTRRHQNDVVTTSNPFNENVTTGANHVTEVTAAVNPTIAAGASPKNSGAVIPNITDGFSGSAPDMGPIVSGRPAPTYGDRGGSQALPPAPLPPTDLQAN